MFPHFLDDIQEKNIVAMIVFIIFTNLGVLETALSSKYIALTGIAYCHLFTYFLCTGYFRMCLIIQLIFPNYIHFISLTSPNHHHYRLCTPPTFLTTKMRFLMRNKSIY